MNSKPLFWIVFLSCMTSCGSALTPADTVAGGIEVEQGRECVTRYSPDAAAEHACRSQVQGTWDAYWAAHFADGGSGQ